MTRILATRILSIVLLAFAFTFSAHAQPPADDSVPKHPLHPVQQAVADLIDQVQQQDSTDASDLLLVPYKKEILAAARKHHLPPALIAGVIQQESVWDEWAERTEPGYLKKRKIKLEASRWSKQHHGLPSAVTELHGRATSAGLMQPMGELARQQGFSERYLSSLFLPQNSIDQGATLLKQLLNRYHNDTLAAISAYNQGNARKKNGAFVNARYVYRVHVGWEAWKRYFESPNSHGNESSNQHGPIIQKAAAVRRRVPIGTLTRQPDLAKQHPATRLNTLHDNRQASRDTARFHSDDRHERAAALPTISDGQPPLSKSGEQLDEAGHNYILHQHEQDAVQGAWVLTGVFVVVFGLGYLEWRSARARARYSERMSQRGHGFI